MTRRAVFDCMIFLQAAARQTGPAAACLELVKNGQLELCVTREVLAEAEDVLTRPKTQRKFPGLTAERAGVFLDDVESRAAVCENVPPASFVVRDPKDQKYLDLAVFAQAPYLVSRDKDLLDLMQDESFRQQFPNLTILAPAALLRELAAQQSPPENAPPDVPPQSA